MDKVSVSHLISSSRYETKCVIKFLLSIDSCDVINFKIFLGSTAKAMADREKKIGKTKIQKLEYRENENSFLDEIKNIFHIF